MMYQIWARPFSILIGKWGTLMSKSITGKQLNENNIFARLPDWEIQDALKARDLSLEGTTWQRRARLHDHVFPATAILGQACGRSDIAPSVEMRGGPTDGGCAGHVPEQKPMIAPAMPATAVVSHIGSSWADDAPAKPIIAQAGGVASALSDSPEGADGCVVSGASVAAAAADCCVRCGRTETPDNDLVVKMDGLVCMICCCA